MTEDFEQKDPSFFWPKHFEKKEDFLSSIADRS